MQIKRISKYAFEYLQEHKYGTIHSVYRKTINICVDGQLLALQAEGSALSALSLITDLNELQMAKLQAKVGTPVQIVAWSRKIILENQCLFWKDPEIVNLSLAGRSECTYNTAAPADYTGELDLLSLKEKIFETLQLLPAIGFVPIISARTCQETESQESTSDAVLQKVVHILGQYQHSTEPQTAAEHLTKLLGLGTGLTPSGDDFLCGFLAGLYFSEQKNSPFFQELCSQISTQLHKTNEISAAFLKCACCGQFSEAVCACKDPDESPQMLADYFRAIGHSSGADTLCGLYYFLFSVGNIF